MRDVRDHPSSSAAGRSLQGPDRAPRAEVREVGWSTAKLDPHAIFLLSFHGGPLEPPDAPPETGAPAAARLLAAASADTRPPTAATALMTAERARGAGPETGKDGSGSAFSSPGVNQQRAVGV